MAITAVRSALEFNVLREKRYRFIREGHNGDNDGAHCPTLEEVNLARLKCQQQSANYKNERIINQSLDPNYARDKEIAVVKREVLDLADKFDYYIMKQIQSG